MRITKRIREEAAVMCAMAVSGPCSLADAHMHEYPSSGYTWSRHAKAVWEAAHRARLYASRVLGDLGVEWDGPYSRYWQSCAEAECLLREGWTP